MGFFKDLKADFSQAVNELIPNDDVDIADNSDQMVNTLDSGALSASEEAENEMMEWLEGIMQDDIAEYISVDEGEEDIDTMEDTVAEAVAEDEIPEDEIPEDEIPEDEIPEDEIPEDEVPEDEIPVVEAPEEDLSEDDILEDSISDDVVLEDSISGDDLYKEEEEIIEEGMEDESEDMTKKVDSNMNENFDVNVDEFDENVDMDLLDALIADDEKEEVEVDLEEEFQEKPEKKVRAASVANDDEVTVISKGTTINGSISSDGSLEIMGSITGDIECLGKLSITGKIVGNSTAAEVYVNTDRLEGSINSEGCVKVGLGTVIIGDILASSGVIAGAVKGEIDINGPIVIDSTAIIKGNIKAKSVQINNGAVIEGFCSLAYSDVDLDNVFE